MSFHRMNQSVRLFDSLAAWLLQCRDRVKFKQPIEHGRTVFGALLCIYHTRHQDRRRDWPPSFQRQQSCAQASRHVAQKINGNLFNVGLLLPVSLVELSKHQSQVGVSSHCHGAAQRVKQYSECSGINRSIANAQAPFDLYCQQLVELCRPVHGLCSPMESS